MQWFPEAEHCSCSPASLALSWAHRAMGSAAAASPVILMKYPPNETGHLIGDYIKEKKKRKTAKNQRIVHLYLSISSWFQAPLRLKKEQSYFKQLLFKQLNSFPDQNWILKLLKHQLPSENEGRSSQEIKWFPSSPLLLAVCLPTGSTSHEPGAIHSQSVMGSCMAFAQNSQEQQKELEPDLFS